MKKAFVTILTTSFLLFACGGNEESTKEVKPKEEVNTEQQENNNDMTQEEVNEQLKKEAEKADFVEINVDNPPEGKKLFIDGKVSLLTEGDFDEFILTTDEGPGEHGMYGIQLANTTDAVYSEGDEVRVYGVVNGKDETGMPKILATILEKK
ncbi:DNA-binding protein [Cytobacillus kochii]|uniref:DNA-binding protein n=1 Tax=Cytobacillus kochii TaxID=859143 RepID=UPI00402AC370